MGQIAAVAMDLVDFSRISAKKLKKKWNSMFFWLMRLLIKVLCGKAKNVFFLMAPRSPRSPALTPRCEIWVPALTRAHPRSSLA